jgi:hypothetical protein
MIACQEKKESVSFLVQKRMTSGFISSRRHWRRHVCQVGVDQGSDRRNWGATWRRLDAPHDLPFPACMLHAKIDATELDHPDRQASPCLEFSIYCHTEESMDPSQSLNMEDMERPGKVYHLL